VERSRPTFPFWTALVTTTRQAPANDLILLGIAAPAAM
jgi:hypothetical protein